MATQVVSELGFHCVGDKRDGWGPYMKAMNDAGRRPSLIKCRSDYSLAHEGKALWTELLTIGANDEFNGDNAFDFNLMVKLANANPWIDYWEVFNEINGDWTKQTDMYLDLVPKLHQLGIKVVMFNCGAGGPQYPERDPVPYSEIARATKALKAFAPLLGLHEYGDDWVDVVGRFRRLADYLTIHDALIPIVITEAAPDPGRFVGVDPFMVWCKLYDQLLMKSPETVGCALFTLGGGGWGAMNYQNALPALADYMTTVVSTAPPIPPPNDYEHRLSILEATSRTYAMNIAALTARMTTAEQRLDAMEVKHPNAQGLDVSHYQQSIDWLKVKSDGPWFVFIKATESNSFIDPTFAANWAGAQSVGLYRGAFHYFRFGVDAVAQAKLFLSALGNDLGELPMVVDVEDTSKDVGGVPAHLNVNEVKIFLDAVQTRTGRKCIIYTGAWYWKPERWGGPVAWAKDYDLWEAWYVDPPVVPPTDWAGIGWKFWQYTSSGKVSGISTNVDLDQFAGSIETLRQYVASVPVPPTPEPTPHVVVYGIGGSADGGDISIVDRNALLALKSRVAGYKFMTSHSDSHYDAVINQLHYAPSQCITRLFWDSSGVTVLPSVDDFVTLMTAGINTAWKYGIRCFEFLNEPNVYSEWKPTWGGADEFVRWSQQVIGKMRQIWLGIQFVSPGLAPAPDYPGVVENTDKWINAFQVGGLFTACEFTGAHVYWRDTTTKFTEEDGLNFHRYLGATSKPLFVTEASNNVGGTKGNVNLSKGQQYTQYVEYIRLNENRVLRVYYYVMSSSDKSDVDSRQVWTLPTGPTDIVRGVLI